MKGLKIQSEHAPILFAMSTQIYADVFNDDMVIIEIKRVTGRNNI